MRSSNRLKGRDGKRARLRSHVIACDRDSMFIAFEDTRRRAPVFRPRMSRRIKLPREEIKWELHLYPRL